MHIQYILIAGHTTATHFPSSSLKGNTTQLKMLKSTHRSRESFGLWNLLFHFSSFQKRRRGVCSAPHSDMSHMYSSAAHTLSWKNHERVQSALFSWGRGDIFQCGIHHTVTIKSLEEQRCLFRLQSESPFFLSMTDYSLYCNFGVELLVHTELL